MHILSRFTPLLVPQVLAGYGLHRNQSFRRIGRVKGEESCSRACPARAQATKLMRERQRVAAPWSDCSSPSFATQAKGLSLFRVADKPGKAPSGALPSVNDFRANKIIH